PLPRLDAGGEQGFAFQDIDAPRDIDPRQRAGCKAAHGPYRNMLLAIENLDHAAGERVPRIVEQAERGAPRIFPVACLERAERPSHIRARAVGTDDQVERPESLAPEREENPLIGIGAGNLGSGLELARVRIRVPQEFEQCAALDTET